MAVQPRLTFNQVREYLKGRDGELTHVGGLTLDDLKRKFESNDAEMEKHRRQRDGSDPGDSNEEFADIFPSRCRGRGSHFEDGAWTQKDVWDGREQEDDVLQHWPDEGSMMRSNRCCACVWLCASEHKCTRGRKPSVYGER